VYDYTQPAKDNRSQNDPSLFQQQRSTGSGGSQNNERATPTPQNNEKETMFRRIEKRCGISHLRIDVASWNVAGFSPDAFLNSEVEMQRLKVFLNRQISNPNSNQNHRHILIFGLQEIVELKPNQLMSYWFGGGGTSASASSASSKYTSSVLKQASSLTLLEQWEKVIEIAVNSENTRAGGSKMIVLKKEQMVGLGLFVLVSSPPGVTQCSTTSIKTAMLGMVGTKGALISFLEFYGITIAALNVHLPSGEGLEAIENRKNSLCQILSNNFLVDSLDEIDFLLFFGDLNARIYPNLSNAKITEMLASSSESSNDSMYKNPNDSMYKRLASFDDLARVLLRETPLRAFSESEISFPPTYKYLTRKERSVGPAGAVASNSHLNTLNHTMSHLNAGNHTGKEKKEKKSLPITVTKKNWKKNQYESQELHLNLSKSCPAYTDRILSLLQNLSGIVKTCNVSNYDVCYDLYACSDHLPVACTFELTLFEGKECLSTNSNSFSHGSSTNMNSGSNTTNSGNSGPSTNRYYPGNYPGSGSFNYPGNNSGFNRGNSFSFNRGNANDSASFHRTNSAGTVNSGSISLGPQRSNNSHTSGQNSQNSATRLNNDGGTAARGLFRNVNDNINRNVNDNVNNTTPRSYTTETTSAARRSLNGNNLSNATSNATSSQRQPGQNYPTSSSHRQPTATTNNQSERNSIKKPRTWSEEDLVKIVVFPQEISLEIEHEDETFSLIIQCTPRDSVIVVYSCQDLGPFEVVSYSMPKTDEEFKREGHV